MRLGGRRLLRLALWLCWIAPAPAEPACPELDQAIAAIVATEPRARADVTERLACRFPPGTTFNAAAIALENAGFGLLNRIERMFHRWPERGDEFVASRRIDGRGAAVEIRVVIHTEGGRLTRFAAQYLLTAK